MKEEQEQVNIIYFENTLPKLKARTIAFHLFLLFAAFCTITIASTLFPFGPLPIFPGADPQTWEEIGAFILTLPQSYAVMMVTSVHFLLVSNSLLYHALTFSCSLLFILISHEMGHYIACRIYKIDASLPYFIPTPPMIGPAGTFGAFIRINSPFPSRKVIFDVGVAGPIAGFIALIPVAMIGILTMRQASPEQIAQGSEIYFSQPLLMHGLAFLFGIDVTTGIANSFTYAAWIGLLVTALNLIPSGQLDGGHAIFAVFGERFHFWTGRIAFGLMTAFSFIGYFYFNSPSGFLIAVLLGVMMRIRHPQPWDNSPLDSKRKLVALITLLIFVLSFAPFPIRLAESLSL